MENSFDWEQIQRTVWLGQENCGGFKGALSDASRVIGCINLSIWSDANVCKFIEDFRTRGKRETNLKSEAQSTVWRQKGNSYFQKEQYSDALSCYTQSVKTAPYRPVVSTDASSPCLVTALGNRSAALYHLGEYELSLEDCRRAIGHGYPKTSLYKVLQRKGQCLLAMGHTSQATEVLREALLALDEAVGMEPKKKSLLKLDLEKLICQSEQSSVDRGRNVATSHQSMDEDLTQSSHSLANASRSLDLQYSTDRGRFLVAEVPVSAGELLIKEMPYAVVLLPEYHATHCHQCCKETLNPVPCADCIDVQYCSDQCLHTAHESHHWLECGLFNNLKAIGTEAWLSLRLFLRAKCWCNVKRVTQALPSMTMCENTRSCDHVGHVSANNISPDGMTSDMSDPSHDESTSHLKDMTSNLHERTSNLNEYSSHVIKEPSSSGSLTTSGETSLFMDEVKLDSADVRDETAPQHCNKAQYLIEGASPLGCGRDGCYRSDYEAVYHLMTHTENHPPQEVFNMTLTAILLSQCIQVQLLCVPQWQPCVCYSSSSSTPHSATDAVPSQPSNTREYIPNQTQQESCEDSMGVGTSIVQQLETTKGHFACGCKVGSRSESENSNKCCSYMVEDVAVLLLRHMLQLNCNAHAVTAIQTLADERPAMDKHSEPSNSNIKTFSTTKSETSGQRLKGGTPEDTRVERQGATSMNAVVQTTKQVRVATAVYPTASLLNHACQPNVIASFEGAVLTMRAIQNIEAGEEILHCYGPHAKHMGKEDRQSALQEQYFFTCSCDACKSATCDQIETCDWSTAYRCFKCAQPLLIRKGQRKVGWCLNPKCKNTQNLGKLSKEKERAANLFKLAQHFMVCKHIEECLGILHQCYNIQREILYQHHKSLGETQDCIAKCYAQMGDFRQSGKFLKLSLATVEKQFGSESIELANELQKLSQVLFNGGEVQDTLSVLDPAIRLLTLHYGPNHQDVQELMQMRSCLIAL